MTTEQAKIDLVNLIFSDRIEKDLQDEEIIHLLLQSKVAKNTIAEQETRLSLGARAADGIAKFAGSWTFILIFLACLVGWIILNVLMMSRSVDPYPFILLNLILSCVAALQAPVIMMSQNRQEEKDRLRSLNDYKTNLKTEIIIEDLHHKIDQLLANQNRLEGTLHHMEKRQNGAKPTDAAAPATPDSL